MPSINVNHNYIIFHTYLEDVLPERSTDLVTGFTETISTTLLVDADHTDLGRLQTFISIILTLLRKPLTRYVDDFSAHDYTSKKYTVNGKRR